MAVGAGSIKRASKLSTEAATAKKEAADKPVTEKNVAKTATKKTPAKKTAQSKSAETKKAQSVKSVKKEAPVAESKKQTGVNKACRLTEEMPIYLL